MGFFDRFVSCIIEPDTTSQFCDSVLISMLTVALPLVVAFVIACFRIWVNSVRNAIAPDREKGCLDLADHFRMLASSPSGLAKYGDVLLGFLQTLDRTIGTPFSRRSFNLSLVLAVIYPFLLTAIIWFVSGENVSGTNGLFDENFSFPVRMIIVFGVGFILFYIVYISVYVTEEKRAVVSFVFMLASIVPGYFIFTVFERLQSTGGGGVLALMIGFLAYFLYSEEEKKKYDRTIVSFFTIITFAIVNGVISGVFYEYFDRNYFINLIVLLFSCYVSYWISVLLFKKVLNKESTILSNISVCVVVSFLTTLICLLSTFAYFHFLDVRGVTFFGYSAIVFFVLVPVINAVFDWLSSGFTRYMFRVSLKIEHSRVSKLLRVCCSLVDLVAGVFLLIGLVFTLVFVLAVNNTSGLTTGWRAFVDLFGILKQMEKDPWQWDYVWVHVMIFSTLLPTAIHAMICATSLFNVGASQARLEKYADWLRARANKETANPLTSASNERELVRYLTIGRWLPSFILLIVFSFILYGLTMLLLGSVLSVAGHAHDWGTTLYLLMPGSML